MAKVIGATEFKAKCFGLLDEVACRRERLLVTKRGKPVVYVLPLVERTPLFGALAGSVTEEANIVDPVEETWADGKRAR